MKVKYEAMAKAGTYEKAGEVKTRWHKVGVVLQGDKGFSLKVESLPINFDGWINFFEPRENGEVVKLQKVEPSSSKKPGHFDDMKDDLPF